MNEILKEYYNVINTDLKEIENGYYFYYLNNKYHLLKYGKSIEQLKELVYLSNRIYENNYKINTFILSSKGNFFVEVLNEKYVLIKVNDIEKEDVTLKDIVLLNNKYISNQIKTPSWDKLWENKIDRIEEELKDYDEDYPLLESVVDFYIGLAENAISYFKDTIKEEDTSLVRYNVNHKRIPLNVTKEYLNNPLNILIDIEVRDIAEYLKTKALNEEETLEDIYYIRNLNLSKASIRLLYSRLMYVTNFFDTLEKVITNEIEEKEITKYIKIIPFYKTFLKDFYSIFSEKMTIPKIMWLYK